MNTITNAEWIQKLADHTDPETGEVCPNEVIIRQGLPPIVRAFYNSRWYEWELIE